ncbi:MAG: S-adenosyl-l-methionine hydroxide adenosyltransferase family protein [Woeseiaceae bacterium]|nr:S-adenosyl-l-methionine hydroxide adenosyltransferase family protein [Woeseiaceae bacterium]
MTTTFSIKVALLFATLCLCRTAWPQNALVFQTDFGLEEPAVASMKGVAFGVSRDLRMFDVTHEIPVFDIWAAAYRLNQVARYWPPGTVFVSVVDPGVGTDRRSVVLKTGSGHYFVSPDNGSLTLVADTLGIAALREIDESVNRLEGSERSHTFHGRDVYAYTGARLAAGVIDFAAVGPLLEPAVVRIDYEKPSLTDGRIRGNVPILDVHYGNVWTNIGVDLFDELGIKIGDSVRVRIRSGGETLFEGVVPYVESFGGVKIGNPAIYVNDILNMGLAINQGDFAAHFGIEPGPETTIELSR